MHEHFLQNILNSENNIVSKNICSYFGFHKYVAYIFNLQIIDKQLNLYIYHESLSYKINYEKQLCQTYLVEQLYF
ncbi:hypothetical protein pb186bvf_017877 [Paramecium bursaria]